MAFRRNGHLEGVRKHLHNQLISVGWLRIRSKSNADQIKEIFQSGVLELRGIAAAGF